MTTLRKLSAIKSRMKIPSLSVRTTLGVVLLLALIARPALAATFTEYPVPTAGSFPNDIFHGPDGNLWFTEYNANKIGVLRGVAAVCGEGDGNGNFNGNNGNGDMNLNSDNQCEDGGNNNNVDSSNVGDGKDFKSTSISRTSFDTLAHTVIITGLDTHAGVPVAFTFVALETGPTTPGWVSFALSDGYTNAGTLVNGSILLH